ncbi:MAG TPA: Ppx/GppA phosphatase family protein [Acidimicrobiales bacterium]|nr:Ppx/GppA phosphatase family protein [Acidimicrobiales bacterium]
MSNLRIAAIDLGSNSFHLLVVETRADGSFIPLVREKEMLRLGDVVARHGLLTEEATLTAIEVIRRFKAIAEASGADELLAYGTAALRAASNGTSVVDEIESETGVRVKVISGIREAQLIFQAVRASVVIDPGPALCADLGGGSLELSVGDRSGLAFATSLHLGVGRLTAEFVKSDPPTKKVVSKLREHIEEGLATVMGDVLDAGPKGLIGSSGTLCAIVRAAAAIRDDAVPLSLNQLTVASKDIAALSKLVFSLPADKRARIPGIDPKRAELLPAGMAVAEVLMEETGFLELTASEWAMREGMILDAITKHDKSELTGNPRAMRRASVLSLCRRSNWREGHGYSVGGIALQLFDATAALHRLRNRERELLELAGLLHDIGEHVSRDGHARHTAYLIENGGLRGFSPEEINLLVCLGRYHTRGRPRESFPAYDALSRQDKSRCLWLLSLLRIADGMDVSHASLVQSLDADITDDEITILAKCRGDAELELWVFQRKKTLLEELTGRPVLFAPESVGPDEFEAAVAGGSGLR